MSNNALVRLRLMRGYTQEELSELSGISVRTIRNLERGQIVKPRRSSVDMLLAVLDPGLRQELHALPADGADSSSSAVAEWMHMVSPGKDVWRGPKPPRTPMIGRESEVRQIAELVTGNQVTVLTGPGGVGKSRVAQAVAEKVCRLFADGVAVAEMGRIPSEQDLDLDSVMELAWGAVEGLLDDGTPDTGRRLLLVLDNTEHLPRTTDRLVDRLIAGHPQLRILITSRRPPRWSGVTLWEIPSLTVEAAVELLLERLKRVCPTLDLSGERAQLGELCQDLDLLPRLVEFAAQRLRMVSLPTLRSDSRARRLLGSADHSMLPHQQSVEASVRWSLNLLDERQRDFLAGLARLPAAQVLAADGRGAAGKEAWDTAAIDMLSELVDSSLLQVDRGSRYEYRMLRHVHAFLAAAPAAEPLRSVAEEQALALSG